MAQLAVIYAQVAVSYIIGRLTEPKAPRLADLTGFKADYGGTIPLIFGPEVRTSQGTIIWATKIKETAHKHKPAMDYVFGLSGALLPARKTYTYSIDLAVLLCGNPINRVVKIWMNSKLVFDAGASTALFFTKADGTHQIFDTLRVYQGTMTQTPDPTIEASDGMGNVPAYLGLHGTADASHALGSNFAMMDDALFRYAFQPDTIGVPLYFRFVQVGQALADATAYLYTPLGTGYGGGSGGVPSTPGGLSGAAGGP